MCLSRDNLPLFDVMGPSSLECVQVNLPPPTISYSNNISTGTPSFYFLPFDEKWTVFFYWLMLPPDSTQEIISRAHHKQIYLVTIILLSTKHGGLFCTGKQQGTLGKPLAFLFRLFQHHCLVGLWAHTGTTLWDAPASFSGVWVLSSEAHGLYSHPQLSYEKTIDSHRCSYHKRERCNFSEYMWVKAPMEDRVVRYMELKLQLLWATLCVCRSWTSRLFCQQKRLLTNLQLHTLQSFIMWTRC